MDMFRFAIKLAGFERLQLLHGEARLARIGNALAMAAVTVTFFGHATAAEKPSYNNNIGVTPDSNSAFSADKDRLSDIFESRWTSATDDFTIGADGVLKPASGTTEGSSADSRYTQMDHPKVDVGVTRSLSQNDAASTDVKGLSAAECGPSEANPELVKALVDAAAARHGVDVAFAEAVAWSESGFDRSRNSPKGARGAMQLMPATAVELGVRDVCDPADNIDGGVRHLRAMLDEFGNPLLAAAAYNAGAEPVYRYGGIPPYPETVSFVARVVNFTLGLKPPNSRGRGKNGQANESSADAEVGVITARKPGAFIGGVMQF